MSSSGIAATNSNPSDSPEISDIELSFICSALLALVLILP